MGFDSPVPSPRLSCRDMVFQAKCSPIGFHLNEKSTATYKA
jgi:hypothetical protein